MLWLQLLVVAPAALVAFGYRVLAHEHAHHEGPATALADCFADR